MEETNVSKQLSYLLRHKKGYTDAHGWVELDVVLKTLRQSYPDLVLADIYTIVEHDKKQRYKIEDQRIRANQGHSTGVQVELTRKQPPQILYHGSAVRFQASILAQGLLGMGRDYVHLSATREVAYQVGKRHGKPVIFLVDSKRMDQDGYAFYLSENGVWLCKEVPMKYLSILKDPAKP